MYPTPTHTVDGRKLNIPLNEIVFPGYEQVVHGEGMPSTKAAGAKGNLVRRSFVCLILH
jgi:hypothetical protein